MKQIKNIIIAVLLLMSLSLIQSKKVVYNKLIIGKHYNFTLKDGTFLRNAKLVNENNSYYFLNLMGNKKIVRITKSQLKIKPVLYSKTVKKDNEKKIDVKIKKNIPPWFIKNTGLAFLLETGSGNLGSLGGGYRYKGVELLLGAGATYIPSLNSSNEIVDELKPLFNANIGYYYFMPINTLKYTFIGLSHTFEYTINDLSNMLLKFNASLGYRLEIFHLNIDLIATYSYQYDIEYSIAENKFAFGTKFLY